MDNKVIDLTEVKVVNKLIIKYVLKNEQKLCDIYYHAKFGDTESVIYK